MTEERIAAFQEARERALAEEALSSDEIGFYEKLFRIQADETVQLRETVSLSEFIKKGADSLSPDDFSTAPSVHTAIISALESAAAAVHSFQSEIDLSEITAHFKNEPSALDGQFRNILKRDFDAVAKFAESHKTISETLIFTLISVLKPLLYVLRTSMPEKPADDSNIPQASQDEEIEDDGSTIPACPFCGYTAQFSSIHDGDDNRLYLHCGLCENRWTYKRLACGVCGSEVREKLTYYTSEINVMHRIDCCDSCGGYIKLFRISKGADIEDNDLFIEDLISGYLDATAMDMGFSRP
jgi:transcription elongation factor Elf1